MRATRACLLWMMMSAALSSHALDEKQMGEAAALRERGEFDKSVRLYQTCLDQASTAPDSSDRRTIEFEIERIRRIRMDYKITREKLLEQLKGKLKDFTDEEFDKFEREGKFDVLVIDGQKFYVNASASNLIIRVPELKVRQIQKKTDGSYRKLYAQMLEVKEAQKLTKSNLLCPQDFAVTFSLTVNPNAVPEGKLVRAWLPFVRAIPSQSDAYMLEADPPDCQLAPPEAAHRTVYMEKPAKKDAPTVFRIRFIYRCWARANNIDPAAVQPYHKESPEYQYYTAERKPHLDFGVEEVKKLNAQIVESETNPILVARRIVNWMTGNLIYQYAREYSTIENISYYCASRKAGDCGQHGMLFIALCRMNGIPARWATGWESFESRGNNMHDWCEFYVEPYGWLPADPDMAVNILNRSGDELDTTQSRELADWMLGNMDHYRLTVNGDYGMSLYPPKNDFRSETVDFQRGEAEWENHNLYFDQWDYNMEIQPIPADEAARIAKKYQPAPVALSPMPVQAEITSASTAVTTEATVSVVSAAPKDRGTSQHVASPVTSAPLGPETSQTNSSARAVPEALPEASTSTTENGTSAPK